MKKTTYPTRLNLKDLEIAEESYEFSRASGELNSALKDLIGTHDYSANLRLSAAGNAYEITGEIDTSMDLSCARCGRDMTLPIHDSFQEMIVVEKEKPRAGHSGHTGGDHEGIFCNYTTSYEFDLAAFVHEHIAAAEPYAPQCQRTDCEAHLEKINQSLQADTSPTQNNPFAVLKNLTDKSQRG